MFIRRWLHSLGRTLWIKEFKKPALSDYSAEGMLILASPFEGIGKTVFPKKLFPKEWQHLFVSTRPNFNGQGVKDYRQITCKSLINSFDEAEGVLNNNTRDDLKTELTAQSDEYRAPYAMAPKLYPRRYSTIASTNHEQLRLSRHGTRRWWWLNISDIDLELLDSIDMYDLWGQIKYEITNYNGSGCPWNLTKSERSYLRANLMGHRTENSSTLLIHDVYDFSTEGFVHREKQLRASAARAREIKGSAFTLSKHATKTLSQVCADIADATLKMGFKASPMSMAQVKRVVTDALQEHAPAVVMKGRVRIVNGIYYLRSKNRSPRYYVPALFSDYVGGEAPRGEAAVDTDADADTASSTDDII
jgi:hypothetical protein